MVQSGTAATFSKPKLFRVHEGMNGKECERINWALIVLFEVCDANVKKKGMGCNPRLRLGRKILKERGCRLIDGLGPILRGM